MTIVKQIAEVRVAIHNVEVSIRKIQTKVKDRILADEAAEVYRAQKLDLMEQMKRLREQQRVAIIKGEMPTLANYGKVLDIRVMGEAVVERTPLRIGEKYDPDAHFMAHEISGFANRLFGKWTWATYVTDSADALKTVLFEGYGEFKCIYAGWSDRDGRAILVHESCPYNTLEDAGVVTNMTNVTQSVKCRKYIGRYFAAGDMNYEPRWGKMQEGSWIEATQEGVIEMENGETLVLRYVDIDIMTEEEKASVDGHIGISNRGHRVLGLSNDPKIGDSWKVTVGERWTGKGHSFSVGDTGADIIVYGPKKLVGLSAERGFCFMSLGELHSGKTNTDIQSVTNFKLYNLAKDLARKDMRWIYIQAHDERKLRNAVMSTLTGRESDEELYEPESEDSFVMRKAVMRDISLFAFPGLYRRAVRFLTRRVLRFEEFRIPMDLDPSIAVAMTKYASMQSSIVLDNGDVDMSLSLLEEGEVCIPDLPDGIDVVVARRPNENANAFYKLRNKHVPEYMGIKGKAVCFLGRQVQKLLGRLGGGDMDDALVVYFDPTWVKHFETLYYPETEKLAAVEVQAYTDYDRYGELGDMEAIDYSKYDSNSAEYQINLATTGGLNIGSTVNANMDDAIKSDPDHMASMLKDLLLHEYVNEAIWLANEDGNGRQKYVTAFLSTNLELVIDAAVKDPALMEALRQEANKHNPFRNADGSFPEGMATGVQGFISAYHAMQRVYPRCMAGRIPRRKKEAGDYVLAMSEQCKAQEAIGNLRNQLDQLFVQNEWLLARKFDANIANHMSPMTDRATKLVSGVPGKLDVNPGLRRRWSALWRENMSEEQADRKDKFTFVCDQLDEILALVPNDLNSIAVELYRQLYKNEYNTVVKNNSTGLYQPFSDSLMWTNKIANSFINQLIANGYAGLWIDVRLFLEKHKMYGEHEVRVDAGVIYNGVNEAIGTTHPKLKPGIWTITDGLIRVREAHPSLKPKYDVLEMIQPLAATRY